MVAIAESLLVSGSRHSGFGLVTLFGLVGMLASFVLLQQGVDLSPTAMF